MATKQPLGPCIHPSPAYYRDFFLLRLPTFINGQPTEIRGPDTRPVLHSSSLDCSVPLSSVAKEASLVLAEYEVSLTRAFYDKQFPQLAIDFSPTMMSDNVSKFLSEQKSVTKQLSAAIEPLFKASNHDLLARVEVNMELHLCSPAKEEGAETTLSIVTCSSARFYVDQWERSKMFEVSNLLHTESGVEIQAKQAPIAVVDLVRELYKAKDQWFTLGVHFKVPSYELYAWKKEHRDTGTECLTAMLQWLLEARQISWADVVQTLVDVDRRNIARDICSRYGVPFPVGKDDLEKGVKTKRKSQMLADMEEPELKNQRVADAKASSDEVRGDLEKIMKEEYPALKGRVAELTRQKEELAEKFRFEREEHEVLLNYRREQSKKSDQKVSSLERMITEKERSLEELQRKLEKSELEYQETRQRLSDLTEELTERTSELERKSSALRELEETQQEEEWELQAKRKMSDDELRRQTARGVSQSEYITEIEIQLATVEKKVEDYSQQIENIRLDLPRKEKEITIVSESLQKPFT